MADLALEVIHRNPSRPTNRPPLLFIHGAFSAAWVWSEHFLDWFAETGWAAYAVSVRGHGASEGGGAQLNLWGIEDYVSDVLRVVDTFDAPPILIGHSMGGFIAQKCLERQAFPALVLMCSVPPKGLLASSLSMIWSRPDLFGGLSQLMSGGAVDAEGLKDALFAQPILQADLQRYLRLSQMESQRAIWDMTMFNLVNTERLHSAPKLVIGAELDHLVPAEQARATAALYGVEPVIFPGMGHGLMLERDWQHVASVLNDWLRAVVAADLATNGDKRAQSKSA